MPTIIEDLAIILSWDEARKQLQPSGYWPSDEPDATIEFAGRQLTQEDLADLVFNKHADLFLVEAAKILATRTLHSPLSFNKETSAIV
jgi:hypothetical protein